jgi:hypothetical protein
MADILTKALESYMFEKFRSMMGVTCWKQSKTPRDCGVRSCSDHFLPFLFPHLSIVC